MTNLEFLFSILNNLVGVCMFAVIVGNIAIIVESINKKQNEFQALVDSTKTYMERKDLPQDFQDQIKRWHVHCMRARDA